MLLLRECRKGSKNAMKNGKNFKKNVDKVKKRFYTVSELYNFKLSKVITFNQKTFNRFFISK